MADDMVRKLVGEQRRRLIAGLLGAAEAQPWYATLTPAQKDSYKKEIMSRVGVYHDFMLDVIKVADDNSVINGHALDVLEQVHASQQRIERGGRREAVASGG